MVTKVTGLTLWKAISARLRQSKTELEEMGEDTSDLAEGTSKYRDEILQLTGFDIQDAAGNFKNLYDIFTGLAQVWDNINGDQAQARVAEILGGTRNLSGVMSTINNIKDAMGAYETAMDSAGVAAQANDKYMETTAAHVGQFKAAFQELSYDLVDGSLMKGITDFGTGAVKAIDGVIDNVGSLGTAIGGIGLSAFIKSLKTIQSRKDTNLYGGIGDFFTKTGGAGAVAAVSLGITAISAAYQQYQNIQENQRKKAAEDAQAYKEQVQALDDYADRMIELRSQLDDGSLSESEAYAAKKELLDIQNQLNESYSQGAENLNLFTGSIDKNAEQIRALAKQNADTFLAENGYGVSGSGIDDAVRAMEGGLGTKKYGFWGDRNYNALLGSFIESSDEGKAIREVADAYSDLIEITDQGGGQSGLFFTGSAKEASSVLTKFITDIRGLKSEFGDSNVIDGILSISTDTLNNANEIVGKYGEIYEQYQQARIIADETKYDLIRNRDMQTAANWMRDYAEAINAVNDAYLYGDDAALRAAVSKYNTLNNAIEKAISPNGSMHEYNDLFSELGSSVLQDALQRYEILSAMTGAASSKARKDFRDTSAYLQRSNLSIDDFLNKYADMTSGSISGRTDKVAQNISKIVAEAQELGYISDGSFESVEQLANILIEFGTLSNTVAEEIDQATMSLDDFSSYQSTLTSALSASANTTGLTADQITSLKEVYENAGLDTSGLFEATANGVHLNRAELEQLNKTIEEQKLTDYAKSISEAAEEYNKLLDAYQKGEKIDGKKVTDDQLKSARDRVNSLKLEEAQYEGLTSAYNKWKLAQSQTDERASYEAVGSGYEGIKDLIEHGWISDSEVDTYLDLVLGKVGEIGDVASRTGDNLKDFAKLTETNAYGHNIIGDYWSYSEDGKLNPGGLETFLSDVNAFDSSIVQFNQDSENTNAIIDLTGDNLARVSKEFGISAEMIQLMERAMVDAGAAMVLDSTNLGLMTDQIQKLDLSTSDNLKNIDFSQASEWGLDELQTAIDALDAEIEITADGSQAEQIFEATKASLESQQARIKVETYMEETGTTIAELSNMTDEDIVKEFKINVNGEDAQAEVDSIKSAIASLESEEVSLTVKLDETQFSELTSTEKEIEATVNYTDGDGKPEETMTIDATVNYTDGDGKPEEPITLEATVNYTDGSNKPKKTDTMTVSVEYVDVGEKPQETMNMTVNVEYSNPSSGKNETGSVVYSADTSQPDSYQPPDKEATAVFNKDSSEPDSYQPPNKSAVATYSLVAPAPPSYPNMSRTITYTIQTVGSVPHSAGTMTSFGIAHADGSMVNAPWNWIPAHAAGDVALKHNEVALTNELGQESIIISIVTLHSDVY